MLFDYLFNRGREPEPETPEPAPLPAELVASIESASVVFRESRDGHEPRAVIRAAGLGSFYHDGVNALADRIARHWPGLAPSSCRRAARLLAKQVAHRSREAGRPARRRGWVHNW